MGHRLDREVERNFVEAQKQGLQDTDITDYIDSHVRMENVLKTTMNHFDGGYVMCGITGSGEMFAMRDTHGIRPAFGIRTTKSWPWHLKGPYFKPHSTSNTTRYTSSLLEPR